MTRGFRFALILGLASIALFPSFGNAKPNNLDLPKSEVVIDRDVDGNGIPDKIVASYFIRPVLVPTYSPNKQDSCQTVPGKFVRYTLFANGAKTGKVILEQAYGTSLASYWVHRLTVDRDLDGDGKKELLFYMGDDTSQESIYLFLSPEGVRTVYLGSTDLPGASLNKDLDLQLFRGKTIAKWDLVAKLWRSQNNRYGWILGDCVEIRDRPDARAKIVSMTTKNEILEVTRSQPDGKWIAVKFPYGKTGWIKSENFSFTSPTQTIRFVKP